MKLFEAIHHLRHRWKMWRYYRRYPWRRPRPSG